jgi:hypothetical protein
MKYKYASESKGAKRYVPAELYTNLHSRICHNLILAKELA